jgi:hypothetical protein
MAIIKMASKKKTSLCNREEGSIFFYILLGVVLFGAVSFVVARGMRSQTTDSLTKRQLEIASSEIVGDAQAIARAVDKIRSNGVSESDLCFAHETMSEVNKAAYKNIAGCNETKNKLYDAEGGGLPFISIPREWLDAAHEKDQGYGEWMFTNENSVIGLGSGDLSQPNSAELIAHVNHLKKDLCEQVNRDLGIAGIPENDGAFAATAPVSQSFTATGQIKASELSGKKVGCFENRKSYIFYTVLLERD